MVCCFTVETTESSTSDNIFNTVPIASWIFVAMGLIVSTLTVSKPVWWDRYEHNVVDLI